jgi:glycosyltransferase involved in cell wall biosynthesis
MRILFLVKHLDGDGIGLHTESLAAWLVSRGWAAGVVSAGGRVEERLRAAGAICYRSPYRRRLGLVANARATLAAARAFRPDALHVQWRLCTPYAELCRRRLGVPYLFALHTPRTRRGAFWGDAAVAVSTETYQELIHRFGVPRARAHLIWNGRDAGHFRPPTPEERRAARRAFDLPEDAFVVAWVGRVAPVKRLDVLLSALPPGALCLICGSGSGDRRPAGDPRARLTGWLQDPLPVLHAADAFALPSAKEGLPLAGIEAMLCGLPVVASSPDLVDAAWLARGRDELAERLARLAADPELRARAGAQALARARQRFALDRMGERYQALYRSIAQARTYASAPSARPKASP